MQNTMVFHGRLLVALKRAGAFEKSQFYFRDVQSDVLSPSCMHMTTFPLTNSFTEYIM